MLRVSQEGRGNNCLIRARLRCSALGLRGSKALLWRCPSPQSRESEGPRGKPIPPSRPRWGTWDCGIPNPSGHESASRAFPRVPLPWGEGGCSGGSPLGGQAAAFCKSQGQSLNMQAQRPHMHGKAPHEVDRVAREEKGWARGWGPRSPHLLSQTQSFAGSKNSKSQPCLPGRHGGLYRRRKCDFLNSL